MLVAPHLEHRVPAEQQSAQNKERVMAQQGIGQRRWAIAEGYIPGWSQGPEPQFTSHETACLLNTSDQDAHVEITIYFSDREPVGPIG